MPLSYPATAADYQILARRKLPPRFLADYLDGGATEEQTLRANVSGWKDIALRQRVLIDVDNVDTRTELAGQSCSMPIALAPLGGLAGMMAQRGGEAQAVKAANAAEVPFTLSTVGICPLAEVKAAATAPFWFQLYMIRDRGGYVENLLKKSLGFRLPDADLYHRPAPPARPPPASGHP